MNRRVESRSKHPLYDAVLLTLMVVILHGNVAQTARSVSADDASSGTSDDVTSSATSDDVMPSTTTDDAMSPMMSGTRLFNDDTEDGQNVKPTHRRHQPERKVKKRQGDSKITASQQRFHDDDGDDDEQLEMLIREQLEAGSRRLFLHGGDLEGRQKQKKPRDLDQYRGDSFSEGQGFLPLVRCQPVPHEVLWTKLEKHPDVHLWRHRLSATGGSEEDESEDARSRRHLSRDLSLGESVENLVALEKRISHSRLRRSPWKSTAGADVATITTAATIAATMIKTGVMDSTKAAYIRSTESLDSNRSIINSTAHFFNITADRATDANSVKKRAHSEEQEQEREQKLETTGVGVFRTEFSIGVTLAERKRRFRRSSTSRHGSAVGNDLNDNKNNITNSQVISSGFVDEHPSSSASDASKSGHKKNRRRLESVPDNVSAVRKNQTVKNNEVVGNITEFHGRAEKARKKIKLKSGLISGDDALDRQPRRLDGGASWQCQLETHWKRMPDGVFPPFVETGRCRQSTCLMGMYACVPKHYVINILRRVDLAACAPSSPSPGAVTSSVVDRNDSGDEESAVAKDVSKVAGMDVSTKNMADADSGVVDEAWTFIEYPVVVGCDCSTRRKTGRFSVGAGRIVLPRVSQDQLV